MALVTLFSKNTPKTETNTQSGPDVHRHLQAAETCPTTSSPDELFAVKAEGWLAEEGGHELVTVDLVDPPSHSPLPLPRELLVRLLFHYGII